VVRVLLCDDHPIFREGLKKILAQYRDVSVVGDVGTGAELLERLREPACDAVVLDISLPDTNGIEVLKQMKSMARAPAVIILSMHPEELIAALRKVARGGRYISPSLAERLALQISGEYEKVPHEMLSDREYQVMLLLVRGKGNKEIAAELALSSPTVATYRARILHKLNLRSTAELVQYVLLHRLLDL